MNVQERIKLMVSNVMKQFEEIPKYLSKDDIDKLGLGTSGIYLNSIYEYLHSVEYLLNQGFIESAGSVATSLWERSITLQYILTNPIILSKEHANHKIIKKTPWSIKQMVNGIVNFEKLNTSRNKNIEKELLYFQYTFLCAIKHGNPYTLFYLNRLDKNCKSDNVIGIRPNYSIDDIDLKNYILLLSMTTALDSLIKFSEYYCIQSKVKELQMMNREFSEIIIKNIPMKLPKIINGTLEEFSNELIEYMRKIIK
jgi:hypothetical protein